MIESVANELGLSETIVIGLFAISFLQIGLQIYAVIDLARRDRVNGGTKWVWTLVILLVNFIGPIIYLTVGRNVPEKVSQDQAPQVRVSEAERQQRIRDAIDSLYGPAPSS